MTTSSPRMTRRRGGWIAAAVIVAVLVAIPITITTVNDAASRGVETQLTSLPLPPGAELLASTSQAGKLSGNGNGMQYLGAILLRSDQSAAEVETFYDSQPTTGDLRIQAAEAGGLSGLHRTPGFLGEPAQPGTVVVYAWGNGPGALFEELDLRGR